MAELLSSEQVMLLNNLMYMNSGDGFQPVTGCKDMSVGDYATQQLANLERISNSGKELSADQVRYQNILKAIQKDSDLSGMVVAGTKIESDADGGGGSAMFVNPQTKEAVVTYRGTGSLEWKDDFLGGARTDQPDGVSTQHQEVALKTYQEYRDQLGDGYTMTVTGHSKGGNKAKYITVMDDSVDRCLSYDGQGFSDEFMAKYKDQIMQNQGKVANHNVDDDFVNLLLNDFGTTTFYKNNRDKSSLVYNHYADAYLNIDSDGNYSTTIVERSKETAALDAFLNSALRSMDSDNRKNTMEMFGDIAAYLKHQTNNGKEINPNDLRDILFSGSNLDSTAYFVAFLVKYENENPEFSDMLTSYLERNGMGEMNTIINGVADAMNSDWMQKIIKYDGILHGLASTIWSILPGGWKDDIRQWIKEKMGLDLSDDQIAQLIDALYLATQYYKSIDEIPSGADISYQSSYEQLYVDFDYLEEVIRQLKALATELENLQSQCRSIATDSAMEDIRFEVPVLFRFFIRRLLGGSDFLSVAGILNKINLSLAGCSEFADALGRAVQGASDRYLQAENEIAGLDF